jgi:hypothetical protein
MELKKKLVETVKTMKMGTTEDFTNLIIVSQKNGK